MNWVINIVWSCLAILLSVFWGIYGCNNEKESIKKLGWIEGVGIFLSEFIGSFAGWSFLYVLILRRPSISSLKEVTNIDIFLAIGAVVGIAGYSYNIGSWIKNKTVDANE